MGPFQLAQSRFARGLHVQRLGPNEARIIFDFMIGVVAAATAYAFAAVFVVAGTFDRLRESWILALPIVLVTLNAALGIYSRLRSASGETKSALLSLTCLLSTFIGWGLTGDGRIAVIWLLASVGPVVLSRWLLNLQYSQSRGTKFVVAAVNENGPVLVIGGAGYIGTHAVEQLLENGYRVRVLDRLMYGEQSLHDFRSNSRFEFIEGDAADIARLTEAMRGASTVIHLAGLVGDPACAVDLAFTRHTNIIVTRMVRLVAHAMGVKRFVFASSCSVYGSSDVPVDELSALQPVSYYAKTKIDSELELLANVPDDFFITVLRFATVFGHSRRPRFDLVGNLFCAQAITEGRLNVMGPQQWRPFVHVRDVARAIVAVIVADPYVVQSQIFNVGDERLNKTILQLAQTVRDVAGVHRSVEIDVTETPDDRRNYSVSFKKIKRILGFRAMMTLEDGIREMIVHQLRGHYADYRRDEYSDVAMTRDAVERFKDPDELSHLYGPLFGRTSV